MLCRIFLFYCAKKETEFPENRILRFLQQADLCRRGNSRAWFFRGKGLRKTWNKKEGPLPVARRIRNVNILKYGGKGFIHRPFLFWSLVGRILCHLYFFSGHAGAERVLCSAVWSSAGKLSVEIFGTFRRDTLRVWIQRCVRIQSVDPADKIVFSPHFPLGGAEFSFPAARRKYRTGLLLFFGKNSIIRETAVSHYGRNSPPVRS